MQVMGTNFALPYLLMQTLFNNMSEIDWEIYYWIGRDTSVSACTSLLFAQDYHPLPPLFNNTCTFLLSLPLSVYLSLCPSLPPPPYQFPLFLLSRWTRKLVLPCMLSICVTCWVLVAGRAGRSKGRSQMLSGIHSTPMSTTLKVSHEPG